MNGHFHPPPPQPVIIRANGYPRPPIPPGHHPRRERRRALRHNVMVPEESMVEERMSNEDLRTWSLTYSLSIEVYVCAERYILQDFKSCIAAFVINRYVTCNKHCTGFVIGPC
jgi:hypothetical protein